jgi:hypothetical protein
MEKRRRFQIHLSTAIILMFAAGGIIWANLTARQINSEQVILDNPNDRDRFQRGNFKIELEIIKWDFRQPFNQIGDDEISVPPIHPRVPSINDSKKFRMGFDTQKSFRVYGWPSVLITHLSFSSSFGNEKKALEDWNAFSGFRSVAINVMSAISILFAVWFVSEWWIRRSKSRSSLSQ